MEEKPDFSKIQNERIDHKKKKVTAVKPIKREIEEIKNCFFKPCYPYSCLISLALKNCSNGQLSVADIYSFVWYVKVDLLSQPLKEISNFLVKIFHSLNTPTQDGRIQFDIICH